MQILKEIFDKPKNCHIFALHIIKKQKFPNMTHDEAVKLTKEIVAHSKEIERIFDEMVKDDEQSARIALSFVIRTFQKKLDYLTYKEEIKKDWDMGLIDLQEVNRRMAIL